MSTREKQKWEWHRIRSIRQCTATVSNNSSGRCLHAVDCWCSHRALAIRSIFPIWFLFSLRVSLCYFDALSQTNINRRIHQPHCCSVFAGPTGLTEHPQLWWLQGRNRNSNFYRLRVKINIIYWLWSLLSRVGCWPSDSDFNLATCFRRKTNMHGNGVEMSTMLLSIAN